MPKMQKKKMVINAKLARKVLKVVDVGLCKGNGVPDAEGNPVLGRMCVEEAVCYAMGEPHSDQPRCVLPVVQETKIFLNDNLLFNCQGARKRRSRALRRLAVAQLGSAGKFTDNQFTEELRRAAALWLATNCKAAKK